MALPFKNGQELANALGFGKLYQASKKKKQENEMMQTESRNINKKIIRMTESDLHNIVKESVRRILKQQ